ncbi:MAG: hypothetical protein NZ578_01340 [Candidatus Binatia bacterium]|nr:hypothetical protein [Candidatus Binatia bacterium]
MSPAQAFVGDDEGVRSEPLLPLIAAHAAQADATRGIDPSVIRATKQTDLMRMSASCNIGGVESSISTIASELEAIARCCASTAWCLWNHLCVFHAHDWVLQGVTHCGRLSWRTNGSLSLPEQGRRYEAAARASR